MKSNNLITRMFDTPFGPARMMAYYDGMGHFEVCVEVPKLLTLHDAENVGTEMMKLLAATGAQE